MAVQTEKKQRITYINGRDVYMHIHTLNNVQIKA